jgi:DNA-binding NarL/FixJ family response regulator
MRQRRAHRRATARGVLGEALDFFEAAGAEPWARQARAELQAAGASHPSGREGSLGELTPQELQVALIVAKGVTNREAAASRFLSEKTVEFHLSNAYRKLGVRSRSGLVRRIEGLA